MNEKQPPSVQAVIAYKRGQPKALEDVVKTYLGRVVILTTAFALLDSRKGAFRRGIIGASAIEAYLFYYFSNVQKMDTSA